jgi:hypothetical protein
MATLYGLFGIVLVVVGVGAPVDWFASVFWAFFAVLGFVGFWVIFYCAYKLSCWFRARSEKRKKDSAVSG